MIDDLRRLEDGAELEADLCVIGAGAAGIAIAHTLLDTRVNVLLLESGGLRRAPATESLNEGEATGMDPASLTAGRSRLLGGATALWAGQCLPPEPSTFAKRPWVPHSGWPLDHRELDRYLRRAEALLRIDRAVYDEAVWDGFGVRRPEFDPHRLRNRFTVWCPRPHLGRLYRRRLAASSNVRVLLHATVTEVVTNPSGDRFDSVLAATPEGKSVRVVARACVLCGGGIENCRLLLASNGVHAAGIGNDHDVVGRFFQDHPNGHSATIVGGDPRRLQELYGLLYRGRVRYLPRLVLSPALQRSMGVLSCAAYPVFHFGEESGIEAARRVYRSLRARRPPTALARDLPRMARDAPRLASAAYRRLAHGRSAQATPSLVTLQTHAEQVPNAASRVTLSRQRDRLGMPVPKVDWRLTELDRRTAEVIVAVVAEEFRRLGLGDVRAEPWLADGSWTRHVDDSFHHMGTTRLGTDPKTSVVNADGQVHGVTGLFIAGSSVFPTAGYANPTLTIVALAIRLGDYLRGMLDRIPAVSDRTRAIARPD
jgi:choline dehydrogenase-like flavoprotein